MISHGSYIIIPAFFASAGILFYTGIQALFNGPGGKSARMCQAFSICSIFAAGYQCATAFYYLSATLGAAAFFLRWQLTFALAFFPAFVVYVSCYTADTRDRSITKPVAAVFTLLLILNAFSTYSLRFENLIPAAALVLPWGETLARYRGETGPVNGLAHLLTTGVLLWAVWRTVLQYRQGDRGSALSLAICTGLIATAGIWGWLIDLGWVDSVYLVGFAFLGFSVLQSSGTAMDLRKHARQLEAAGIRLQAEMDRRWKVERVIAGLRAGVSFQTGTVFFERLAEQLAAHFGADYALIGLLDEPDRKSITTLAVWAKGALVDNLNYPLGDTPCTRVAGQRTQVYSRGLRELFPDDLMARTWEAESYVGTPLFDAEGKPLGIVMVASSRPLPDVDMIADVLEIFAARASAEVCRQRAEIKRAAAEEARRRSHELLKSLTDIQRDFLLDGDANASFERLLSPLLQLTESRYGFIGEVLYDESQRPYLKIHVYSNVPWDGRSRRLYDEAVARGMEFHNLNSLIGAVLQSGATVIANDAPNDSRDVGLPEGHPSIESFLGLPVRQGGALIGMIGIANRQGGYDSAVESYLEPFLNTCAALLWAFRSERDRQTMEAKVQESEERFHTLADSLPVKVWLADMDGHCTWFNRTWLNFTGRSLEEELGYGWLDDVHPDDRERCIKVYAEAFRSGKATAQEYRLRRHDGQFRSVVDATAPRFLRDGRIAGYVGACMDLTERRTLEAQVEHLAYHDVLTGLPNRALLMDRIGQALSRARRDGHQVALLFTDLDRFKMINDTLGHSVGDALLHDTAKRIREMIRKEDTVARIGGDEFVILLPKLVIPREVIQVANKLLAALSIPFNVLGHTLHVTTSVGVSLFPQDGLDADTLLKHADVALYQAKDRGGAKYQLFDSVMNAVAERRLLLENCLRMALLRNEFLLYYQPRVDLGSGVITGVEALIRWRHPERGLLLPDEFIRVAEEIGMIREIGQWVLHAACCQARAWTKQGLPPLRIAVNVSARQLHDPELRDQVEQVLLHSELPPSWLDLELTESSVMADPERSIATLGAIRSLGVHLALDDFGTGYSSLAYLKRLPVDCLKIDRAFVAGIPDDPEDSTIAQTILAMARSLGLVVIAEGVETSAQRDFLRGKGCHEAQGYLFSIPLPPEKLEEFLRANRMDCDNHARNARR
ncbi:MAG: bifunctional diguanylate cyclase/phosphodiesterase [Gammaproteobacteria bacterium]